MNEISRSTMSGKALVRKWNKSFPIGTKVRYWTGVREGIGNISTTRTEAQFLGGHTPIVWIEGVSGCVALSHVEPIPA